MDYHNIFILTLLMIVTLEIFFTTGALGQQQINSEGLQTVVITKDYYDILTNCHSENSGSRYEDLLQRISAVEKGYISERLQFIENFEHLHEALKRLMKVEEDNDNLKFIVKQQTSEIETMKTTIKENEEKIEQLVNASNSLQNDNENFILEVDNLNAKLHLFQDESDLRYSNITNVIRRTKNDFDNKMDIQTNTISDKILEINQNHSAFRNSYETLEQRLNNINESCDRDTERVVAETIVMKDEIVAINENIEYVTSSLSNTKRIVAALSNSSLGNAVAFYAWFSKDSQVFNDRQAVIYNNVVTNVGTGYNITNGHFIAPVKGVYMFAITSMGKSGIPVHLNIMKNGKMVGCVRSQNDPNLESGSKVIVLELEVSDAVWIQSHPNLSFRLHSHNGIYAFNTFSGFLVQ